MKSPASSARRAFSLIEVTIALAILSLLTGMVAIIAYNTMTLSTQLVTSQREEMRTQAFLDWVRRSFGNLPGNALWQIVGTQGTHSSSAQLADMVLQDVPLMLYWSDTPLQIKALRLRTLKQDNGFLKVVLECYDEEILDQTGQADSLALLDIKPVATTVLLEDVRWCEWMVRNPKTDEWSEALSRLDPRPYQLELNLAFGSEGQNIREVFWIAPKQNPKILVQEFMSSRSGSRGGGNGGNHDHSGQGGSSGQPNNPSHGSGNGSKDSGGGSGNGNGENGSNAGGNGAGGRPAQSVIPGTQGGGQRGAQGGGRVLPRAGLSSVVLLTESFFLEQKMPLGQCVQTQSGKEWSSFL